MALSTGLDTKVARRKTSIYAGVGSWNWQENPARADSPVSGESPTSESELADGTSLTSHPPQKAEKADQPLIGMLQINGQQASIKVNFPPSLRKSSSADTLAPNDEAQQRTSILTDPGPLIRPQLLDIRTKDRVYSYETLTKHHETFADYLYQHSGEDYISVPGRSYAYLEINTFVESCIDVYDAIVNPISLHAIRGRRERYSAVRLHRRERIAGLGERGLCRLVRDIHVEFQRRFSGPLSLRFPEIRAGKSDELPNSLRGGPHTPRSAADNISDRSETPEGEEDIDIKELVGTTDYEQALSKYIGIYHNIESKKKTAIMNYIRDNYLSEAIASATDDDGPDLPSNNVPQTATRFTFAEDLGYDIGFDTMSASAGDLTGVDRANKEEYKHDPLPENSHLHTYSEEKVNDIAELDGNEIFELDGTGIMTGLDEKQIPVESDQGRMMDWELSMQSFKDLSGFDHDISNKLNISLIRTPSVGAIDPPSNDSLLDLRRSISLEREMTVISEDGELVLDEKSGNALDVIDEDTRLDMNNSGWRPPGPRGLAEITRDSLVLRRSILREKMYALAQRRIPPPSTTDPDNHRSSAITFRSSQSTSRFSQGSGNTTRSSELEFFTPRSSKSFRFTPRSSLNIRSAPSIRESGIYTIRSSTSTYHTVSSGLRSSANSLADGNVQTASEWKVFLQDDDIQPDYLNEQNWSGRGQHAEYEPNEEDQIPLQHEREISVTDKTKIDSVRCRRIRLARKTIPWIPTLAKRKLAIQEVKLLQKLNHAHIIRVVGSYTINRQLSILLYPVADEDLATYIKRTCEFGKLKHFDISSARGAITMVQFFACLANALQYIHSQNVRHRDIKPKNILVKRMLNRIESETPYQDTSLWQNYVYKVYITDFDISRAYKTPDDAETEGPTAYTRIYAAPEVIDHYDKRSFPSDVFSLGCCFAEMLEVLARYSSHPPLKTLQWLQIDPESGRRSYQGNLEAVQKWVGNLDFTDRFWDTYWHTTLENPRKVTLEMIRRKPSARPSMAAIVEKYLPPKPCCLTGQEAFEASFPATSQSSPWI